MRFVFALFDFYESSLDWLYQGRRLSKRLGSKALCIPLFSLPGERVCVRAYFPDTSDIPTIQLVVALCDFLSFSLMSTSVIYF